jgi:hypothetical protein
MIDTSRLVVGQDVHLNAGVYSLDGKVVKIRWWGVYVQTYMGWGGRVPSYLIQFNKEGKERGGDPLLEGGPWHINPLPGGAV